MKILNIDALVAPKRELTLAGVTHTVLEISAQQFVDSLAKSEALEAAGSTIAPSQVFVENVQMVLDLVPTLNDKVLMNFPLVAVITILKFCRGDDDGIAVADSDEGSADPKSV
jgi:hypothetical protein